MLHSSALSRQFSSLVCDVFQFSRLRLFTYLQFPSMYCTSCQFFSCRQCVLNSIPVASYFNVIEDTFDCRLTRQAHSMVTQKVSVNSLLSLRTLVALYFVVLHVWLNSLKSSRILSVPLIVVLHAFLIVFSHSGHFYRSGAAYAAEYVIQPVAPRFLYCAWKI